MLDKYIGQEISGYKIIRKTDKKDSSNHSLYECICSFCNSVELRSIRTLKAQKGSKCSHFDKFGFPNFPYNFTISSRLTRAFRRIKERCYNKDCIDYKWYGGKGVRVCDEWLYNPVNFSKWAMANGYSDDLTIDRIDSNGNYEPSNCRWISIEENSRRAGNVNWLTVNGETLSGRQWAKKLKKTPNFINLSIKKVGVKNTILKIEEILSQGV